MTANPAIDPPRPTRRRHGPLAAFVATLSTALLAAGCTVPRPAVPPAAGSTSAEVRFTDESKPTRCAEEDNVHVALHGDRIAAFRIVGEHPPYIGGVTTDSTAPDFTDCDMSGDPVFRFTPRTVVLHEDATHRLVGHAFGTFWRPEQVTVRVGGREERGLHLLQLIRRGTARDVEMLVVYPSDGYWRLKPLPPAHLPDTAYGSSFLVGPVTFDGRPYVPLRSIDIDPVALSFALVFGDGTRGMLSVASVSPARIELAVTLDPPVAAGRSFAALRSMYVTPANADVSRATFPARGAAGRDVPILGFGSVVAPSARFGRVERSMHNLSAPDVVFEGFARR
jgi:hypothetical protein